MTDQDPITIHTVAEIEQHWEEIMTFTRKVSAPPLVSNEISRRLRNATNKYFSHEGKAKWMLTGKDAEGLNHRHLFNINVVRKNKVISAIQLKLDVSLTEWKEAVLMNLKTKVIYNLKKGEVPTEDKE